MRLRTFFTPSFRNRLRLFFVVIVIIPMIAVGLVLFELVSKSQQSQTDAQLSEVQRVALNLYQASAQRANAAGRSMAGDPGLSQAIADRKPQAITQRLQEVAATQHIQRAQLEITGQGRFQAGSDPAVAPAGNALQNQNGKALGRLVTSVDSAQSYATQLANTAEVGVVISQGGRTLAASRPELGRMKLPEDGSATVDGTGYRVRTFGLQAFGGPELRTRILIPDLQDGKLFAGASLLVLGAVVGFLILAIAFAITVTRTLQAEVRRLLEAAREIGQGNFAVEVPEEGNDEFAALGSEFNSMSRQLEARLEELATERARLQEAIRRVGESFTASLDRVGLLEIVVQTAVDGVQADTGRATIRRSGEDRMREVATTGERGAHERALQAAEAAALNGGALAEIELGGTYALAAPLQGDEGTVGAVSVARGGRKFDAGEHELFSYLTNQAAQSVENVDLHETVQRQAVTDELTGLFNHRRFQEVMTTEVERARRYDQEMGLIMLDLDDFKRVNDTYGHLQGDEVLRAVATVLRQSSREIDEPARYGGEEMAVALPQTDLEGAFQFAERVRRRIEALALPLPDGEGVLRVTASFGAASLGTAGGVDKDAMVGAADHALYQAKRAGKNRTERASARRSRGRQVHPIGGSE